MLMKEFLLTLQYVHSKGLSHKEISPSNILCSDDISDILSQNFDQANNPHVILTNFGQASGFRRKNLITSPISSVIIIISHYYSMFLTISIVIFHGSRKNHGLP